MVVASQILSTHTIEVPGSDKTVDGQIYIQAVGRRFQYLIWQNNFRGNVQARTKVRGLVPRNGIVPCI